MQLWKAFHTIIQATQTHHNSVPVAIDTSARLLHHSHIDIWYVLSMTWMRSLLMWVQTWGNALPIVTVYGYHIAKHRKHGEKPWFVLCFFSGSLSKIMIPKWCLLGNNSFFLGKLSSGDDLFVTSQPSVVNFRASSRLRVAPKNSV